MSDPEFFDVADKFINLANDLVKDWDTPRISAALLYAASRFNAHNFYATDGKNKRRAVKYYCGQYKKMLLDNLDALESVHKANPTEE